MRYVIAEILLLLCWLVFPADMHAYNKPYVINFSKEKYGASNKNWAIGQDERGIMYFANDVGLLEYDGIGWELNTIPNRPTIRSVAVLSNRTLFTGSYEEFGRWDRDLSGKLQYTSLSATIDKSEFENDDFWKIWANGEFVYFQSFGSVFVYDYDTVRKLPLSYPILFLTKVRDEYWVQRMGDGIYRLQEDKLQMIPGSDIFNDTDVRIILPFQTDKYLIGTAGKGIYIYDGEGFKEWNPELSEIMRAVDLNCGMRTMRDTYVFGTILDGIYEVDENGRVVDRISTENMLQNNTILSLFEDHVGNIWAGLDRGISFVQYLPKMSCYIDSKGNMGSAYEAIFWDDKLFLGTNQGVYYIRKADLEKSGTLSEAKLVEGTQGQVWSFIIADGKLYCCHNRGIREIHKNLSISEPYNLTTGVYKGVQTRLKGRDVLLLSTYNLLKLVDKQTGVVHDLNPLNEPIINTEVDHLENVWLEHFNKGVFRCRLSDDMQRIESYTYLGGDSGDQLPYKLKVFKVGGRVVLLGDDCFYNYDDISDAVIPNEHLNNCFRMVHGIRNVVHIQGSIFWALTRSAIYKFSYDGYDASIIESYDLGSKNLSLVNSYENISIANDSINIVCLDNGFLLYDNQKDAFGDTHLEPPFLKSFQVEAVGLAPQYKDLSETIEVPYKYNSVTIRFSAKNTLASSYYFQYILEGVDPHWSESQKINRISYVRLPEGEYTLKIRTLDNLGNYSEPVSCTFHVQPPWYQSVWAYLAYLLLAALTLLLIWMMILRRYRNVHLMKIRSREAKRLRRKNEELLRELEEKNAELLTQTSFVIRRNELLMKIKGELEDFYRKQNNKSLAPLFNKVDALLSENIDTEEDWKMFLINFEQKHTGFFKHLKADYPSLTSNDLKLCACLRLNLDSKDIAALMNVSVRSVENSRSRLRKKLNISASQHLNEFFLQF
ncbi:DNA-binding CsgD family transcriptional regulator [Parabacteroides sp. PF5-5]|uniref:triple tyrosine motif-containing protein n=1 Tax=unclassified Parabacteroides TaxID=2649774 RepID=UPI002474354A|nr:MULTISPECIES: triple tyrosine motif-containing protein [unclassified Parabacteroides]MDH6306147.1 DNA-binding CsgD family transcriptional regulator [Parabacteroides sp. PH5-39]MDH6317106.1 DNA-binding CsgD family transcriptional regulator [Parabacteroides sp. PF5-13]MDH6320859.1 DNA-binding CsgD family transcriptional regulator [Parabacteroides sp. PH5-13]MDH6324590.1 DNA-binding CsgD family transcriptional regulator [Parabacteroides sp. PH5-8]MDH6328359.1 DNA-binding CsgD family transcript